MKRDDETQTEYTIRLIKAQAWAEGHRRHANQCVQDEGSGLGAACRNPYDDVWSSR